MASSQQRTTLAVARKITGLAVKEFAELVGKSVSAIQSVEAGRLKLSGELAGTIAKAIGVSKTWLLFERPEIPPYYRDAGMNKLPFTEAYFRQRQADENWKALTAASRTEEGAVVDQIASSVVRLVRACVAARRNGDLELGMYQIGQTIEAVEARNRTTAGDVEAIGTEGPKLLKKVNDHLGRMANSTR